MIEKHASIDGLHSRAWYSTCEQYRYGLQRIWNADGPVLLYVMLNPSTATELQNDPTIERCQRRAIQLGFGSMKIANLFAYRATRPDDLRKTENAEGPENATFLDNWCDMADMTLAAWGVHGAFQEAGPRLAKHLHGDVRHLGLTKQGHPRHPLYVSYKVSPRAWPLETRYAA